MTGAIRDEEGKISVYPVEQSNDDSEIGKSSDGAHYIGPEEEVPNDISELVCLFFTWACASHLANTDLMIRQDRTLEATI